VAAQVQEQMQLLTEPQAVLAVAVEHAGHLADLLTEVNTAALQLKVLLEELATEMLVGMEVNTQAIAITLPVAVGELELLVAVIQETHKPMVLVVLE
jgi:hypothetical protein